MFPTTHWSLLARATLSGDTSALAALDQLFRRYWPPLNQFIRARGHDEAGAADLTQAFCLHVMQHSVLRKADHSRGRFRSFLLGALVRFLRDERQHREAAKRGGKLPHTSFDEMQPGEVSVDVSEMELVLFDRAWAVQVMRGALERVREEFAAHGREHVFLVVRDFLPGAGRLPSYEEAARQLGMSLAGLNTEVHRLRQRVKALIREEVMSTLASPHEIADELAHLQKVLMDRGTELPTADES